MMTRLAALLARFRDDVRGTLTVEAVIIVPILFWTLTATWEFFEVHRFKSVREKASYAVVDMISREQNGVTENYIDNTLLLFNEIARRGQGNQIRLTVVQFDENDPAINTDDEYSVIWSETRGDGPMEAMTTAEIKDGTDFLPAMADGAQLIMIQSHAIYRPAFQVGLADEIPISTHVITSPRFVEQVTCADCSG